MHSMHSALLAIVPLVGSLWPLLSIGRSPEAEGHVKQAERFFSLGAAPYCAAIPLLACPQESTPNPCSIKPKHIIARSPPFVLLGAQPSSLT
jgi:hypothetical protein